MEIVKLNANDYDEMLYVLNTTFSKQNGREMDFEKELPKMCIRDDFHTGKHIAVKEDGKICALLGVYPMKLNVCGCDLKVSTVGNVATFPGYEGKGYMRLLMEEAMNELERNGADASRLCGDRQRYNRYGYEIAGYTYDFIISGHNAKYCTDNDPVKFRKICADDTKELQFIRDGKKKEKFYVDRSIDDTYSGDYMTICSWGRTPYIVVDEQENMTGYICVESDNKTIADIYAKDLQSLKNILFGWQKLQGRDINFKLMPWQTDAVRYFSSVSACISVSSPSQFKIINFDKVADAFIKMKALYSQLPDGKRIIGIDGWGNLEISVENGNANCRKTDEMPSMILDKLSATRLLFGPLPVETVADADEFLSSVLPLPFSWNTLDRL